MYKKSCDNCQLNVGVCAGRNEDYGKDIEEMKKKFPNGCEAWELAFKTFMGYEDEDEDV